MKYIYSFLLLLISYTFISCGEDRIGEYEAIIADKLWIEEEMRKNYLWYQDMPEEGSLNYFLAPTSFFKTLLKKGDNYSTIEVIEESTRAIPYESSYGFEFVAVISNVNNKEYYARVLYVVPDSPAERAGLKRGNWISHINDKAITSGDIAKLYDGEAVKLTLSKLTFVPVKQENEEEEEEKEPTYVYNWTIDTDINIEAAQPIKENPIFKTEIIETDKGPAGYLLYNSFYTGEYYAPKEDPYIQEMANVFSSKFKGKVKHFILDLRYNSGGYLDRAHALASLLVPKDKLNETFCFLEYSDKRSDENKEILFSESPIVDSNIDLDKLYVITSSNTASAAELVFYCLMPYMDVTIVGETTEGKNVGSSPIESEINSNIILHPIVNTIYDKNGETYPNGITPDIVMKETDNKNNDTMCELVELGDSKERLLNQVIKIIENGGEIPKDKEEEKEEEISQSSIRSGNLPFHSISRKVHNSIRLN